MSGEPVLAVAGRAGLLPHSTYVALTPGGDGGAKRTTDES